MVDQKVFFKREWSPNLRELYERIFYHLIALGLKIEKNVVKREAPELIVHEIYGIFPGGQQSLDREIEKIRKDMGPYRFIIDLTNIADLFNASNVWTLNNFGFKVVNEQGYIFELEFPGPEAQAICALDKLITGLTK